MLAYQISEHFYHHLHYVWCTTEFGSPGLGNMLMANPASSLPYERYRRLQSDIHPRPDLHSSNISGQRVGIKHGADEKFTVGAITATERDEIHQIADQAQASDFEPLVYLIPYEPRVKKLLKKAPLTHRAHPLSDEWIIENLPTNYFDIQRF